MRDQTHQVMTVKETAEFLRLAITTVYKLANEGNIPARKVGGSWRFSRRALDDWLREPDQTGRNLEKI